MGYSLKFEHPHFDEEKEFAVTDLGLVKNGGSIEVDEDMERLFVANNEMSIEDAFKSNDMITLSGSSTLSGDELKTLLPEPKLEDVVPDVPEVVISNDGNTPAESEAVTT